MIHEVTEPELFIDTLIEGYTSYYWGTYSTNVLVQLSDLGIISVVDATTKEVLFNQEFDGVVKEKIQHLNSLLKVYFESPIFSIFQKENFTYLVKQNRALLNLHFKDDGVAPVYTF